MAKGMNMSFLSFRMIDGGARVVAYMDEISASSDGLMMAR